MTDHADTIRRADEKAQLLHGYAMSNRVDAAKIAEVQHEDAALLDELVSMGEALLAERQQAIDARDALALKLEAETQMRDHARSERDYFRGRLGDFSAVAETDRARCEQAIDALRQIDCLESPLGVEYAAQLYAEVKALVSAALVNLGEQP